MTTRNPREERVIKWVRNRELGFKYMFNSISLKEVWVKNKVKIGNKTFGLCERWLCLFFQRS